MPSHYPADAGSYLLSGAVNLMNNRSEGQVDSWCGDAPGWRKSMQPKCLRGVFHYQ